MTAPLTDPRSQTYLSQAQGVPHAAFMSPGSSYFSPAVQVPKAGPVVLGLVQPWVEFGAGRSCPATGDPSRVFRTRSPLCRMGPEVRKGWSKPGIPIDVQVRVLGFSTDPCPLCRPGPRLLKWLEQNLEKVLPQPPQISKVSGGKGGAGRRPPGRVSGAPRRTYVVQQAVPTPWDTQRGCCPPWRLLLDGEE